jgi:hypothetical protein
VPREIAAMTITRPTPAVSHATVAAASSTAPDCPG